MRSKVAILSLLLGAAACHFQNVTSEEENTVISLALRHWADKGAYTILDPRTRLHRYNFSDGNQITKAKESIKKNLKIPGYDATVLIDRLFERNRTQISISLRSDPSKGYLIDRDGKFASYFSNGCGGWDEFYAKNPHAAGVTTISAPVLDRRNRIALMYIGTQLEGLNGVGGIIAYSFEDGKLRKLTQIDLWIS
jgi:hypothetical protein